MKGNFDVEIAEKHSTTRRATEQMLTENSNVYKQQVDQISSVFADNKKGLGQTQKLLINLGIAIYSGKDSAIDWSITRVLNHGGTADMVKEVIEIAALNGGTLSMSSVRMAYNVLELRKINRKGSH